MNISMPVEIFDGASFLQRIGKSFGHAPLFLKQAGQTKSVVEQI
jgi:hypothetical protein